jgi:hypothetical protein
MQWRSGAVALVVLAHARAVSGEIRESRRGRGMGRTSKGHFMKGTSGNPAGRPRSSLSSVVRSRIEGHVDELIALLLGKAREGDVQAARTLLERVVPNLKPEEPAVQVDVPADVGLADTGRAVIRAAIDGVLPPGQAAALVGAVGTVARVVEIDELIRRVEALEGKGHAGT